MVRHLATGVLALVLLVAQAAPAEAHTGDKSGPTNYETVIAGVTPAVAGLRVRSIDLSSQMELRNETGRTVVVLGYEDEPYLKVTPDDGIYLNMESPAAYLNATRTGKNSVPADVDPKAKPRWEKAADGRTARWHDHRAHWMASEDPPVVRADRSRSHVVIPDWQIPLRIGNRSAVLSGDLTWSPGPRPLPYWLAAAVAATALTAISLGLRRCRRIVPAVAVLAGVAASFTGIIGHATAPARTGSTLARLVSDGGLVLGIGWAGGLLAAWWLLVRRRDDGLTVAGVAGLVFLLGAGLGESAVFARAHLGTSLDPTIARALVATNIAAGAALGAIAILVARPQWLRRLFPTWR